MKFVKWLGIGLGGIVALLGLIIAIITFGFDPNAYKDDITRYVKDNQQRTLTIPGKLHLSFYPKLGIQVGALSLSEFNSDAVFASVAGATVSVELLPLLSKQVVVDRVQVDGLSASIVRGKDGRFNFDDFVTPVTTPEAPAADAPQASAPAFRLDIDRVKIANASLRYQDRISGTQLAVSQWNLQTGRIADKTPTTLKLSATIDGVQPKAAMRVKFAGGMTMDLDARTVAFAGLAASAQGDLQHGATMLSDLDLAFEAENLQLEPDAMRVAARAVVLLAKGASAGNRFDVKAQLGSLELDGATRRVAADRVVMTASGTRQDDPFVLSLDAPRLSLSPEAASGETITGAVKLAGRQKLDARFALAGVSGNARSFAISSITLDYDAASADSTAVGNVSMALAGNLDTQVFELTQIDGKVKVDNPDIPARTVTLPIHGGVRADLGKGMVRADLRTRFDDSAIEARLAMPTLAPPSFDFDVTIDTLDVDRYRSTATTGASTGASAPAAIGSEPTIDLGALKSLRATGRLRIGALKLSNVRLSQLDVALDAAGGKLQLDPVKASLYGGSMQASAGVDANRNAYRLKSMLSGVQVGPLLKDAADQDILEGKGNVVVDVTTQGTVVSALKRGLDGRVGIRLSDGAIKGINIAERIRKAKSLLGANTGAQAADKSEKTDFSELSLSATVAKGVATSNDLTMASPLLRAKGAGQVDIGANTLDYTIRPKLVATAKGQQGKTYEQLSGIEMPVRIYGALDAPQYKPDYAAAAMSAAKSDIGGRLLEKAGGGKAGGLLGSLLGKEKSEPTTEDAGTSEPVDPKKKARELLKGLFN
ncbi:AsmA family protein [Comamonadaceae bacterium G21597-S1]|nr:AsmA family protein [Comamonadaceae bacterium G21597-S1]